MHQAERHLNEKKSELPRLERRLLRQKRCLLCVERRLLRLEKCLLRVERRLLRESLALLREELALLREELALNGQEWWMIPQEWSLLRLEWPLNDRRMRSLPHQKRLPLNPQEKSARQITFSGNQRLLRAKRDSFLVIRWLFFRLLDRSLQNRNPFFLRRSQSPRLIQAFQDLQSPLEPQDRFRRVPQLLMG